VISSNCFKKSEVLKVAGCFLLDSMGTIRVIMEKVRGTNTIDNVLSLIN
jgi:hypothetical protein